MEDEEISHDAKAETELSRREIREREKIRAERIADYNKVLTDIYLKADEDILSLVPFSVKFFRFSDAKYRSSFFKRNFCN